MFSNTLAFLQLLLVLAVSTATWKCYKYYKRYRLKQRRDCEVTSHSAFNYQLPKEITEEIFRYLDPGSLLTAAQVNRTWQMYSYMDSIRGVLFERECPKPTNFKEIEQDINVPFTHQGHVLVQPIDYSSSPYLKQWYIEDNVLSKRLNKKIIDVTLLSAGTIISMHPNPQNTNRYLLKTRVKWTKEEDSPDCIIVSDTNIDAEYYIRQIDKNLIPIKNVGEEYEIIADFDKLTREYRSADLEIHRFRVTKFLNPWKGKGLTSNHITTIDILILGLLMILLLIYAPILLKDMIAVLRAENSENLSLVIVSWAGVAMSIYLNGSYIVELYRTYRRSRYLNGNFWRLWKGWFLVIAIALDLVRRMDMAIRYFDVWRNVGLCWIIGIALYEYFKFAHDFWFRRYQIGLKKSKATISIAMILFIYAVDWSILLEFITTGRIWRTLLFNAMYSCVIMLVLTFERIIIESLYALRLTWSGVNVPLKNWIRGLLAHFFVVVIFTMHSPAGFDNLY